MAERGHQGNIEFSNIKNKTAPASHGAGSFGEKVTAIIYFWN